MSSRDEQPSYIAFAAANVRQKAPTSSTIVNELLDRVYRDAAALKAAQPNIIGYVVVGKSNNSLDWDGQLHPSEEACIDSLCGPYQGFTREPASEFYWGNEYKLCPVLDPEAAS